MASSIVLATGNGGSGDASVRISVLTAPDGKPTATITFDGAITPAPVAPTQSSSITTITKAATSTTPSPTAETQSSSGLPLSTLLPAIVAPVAFILILASVILFTCLHIRNKRRERLDSGEHGMPVETQPLNKKPSNSFILPSPLGDNDRTQDGSLGVYEKRKSMGEEAAKRNTDIIGLYERPSANGPAAYNYDGEKYTTPRMPAPVASVARGPPPPPASRTPPNRTPPQSRAPPQQRRAPPPPGGRTPPRDRSPLPPSKVPPPPPQKAKPSPPPAPDASDKQVESSWPLPAGGPLPSPSSMHSSKTGRSSRSASKSGGFQLPPVSTSEPFSMREALRPESDTYDLSTSAATSVPKVPPFPGGYKDAKSPYDRRSRKRESDAISELSDRERGVDDTDRLSVVSAMSGR